MLKYEKKSLFDVPEGSLIVHGCNAQGVWGRGIAKEFKERYPKAYELYQQDCARYKNTPFRTGRAGYFNNNEKHWVGWLITSDGYAKNTDSVEIIKINTTLALNQLLLWVSDDALSSTIYSNKFNSGLFRVPWEETERILKAVLKRYPNVTWIVCDPNLVDSECEVSYNSKQGDS